MIPDRSTNRFAQNHYDAALERQDLSCANLAHHELQSVLDFVVIVIIIIIIIMIVIIIIIIIITIIVVNTVIIITIISYSICFSKMYS